MALVRLVDPKGDNVDSHPLQLGKDLEIKVAATGDRATTRIFKGQIAAVEPEFTAKGCIISIRAYDKAHKLNRAAQDADVPADVGLRHGHEDRQRGRTVARGDGDQRRPRVLPAEQRDRLGLHLAARADARLRGRRRRHEARSSAPPTTAAGRRGRAQVAGHADLVPPAHERRAAADRRSTSAPGTRRARQGRHGTAASGTTTSAAGVTRARSPTISAAARPRSPTASRPTTARPTRSPSPRWTGWPTRSTRPTASPSARPRSRPAARSRSTASASSSAARSPSRPRRTATAARPATRPRSRSPGAPRARCWS